MTLLYHEYRDGGSQQVQPLSRHFLNFIFRMAPLVLLELLVSQITKGAPPIGTKELWERSQTNFLNSTGHYYSLENNLGWEQSTTCFPIDQT